MTEQTPSKSAQHESNAAARAKDIATLADVYDGLPMSMRPQLMTVAAKFLSNPRFLGAICRPLGRRPYRLERETFPLMRLPTELRVMIAKYALSFAKDLHWCWKEQDGKRIGGFRKSPYYSKADYEGTRSSKGEFLQPLNNLCVSRQLRQETDKILFSVNELRFSGRMNATSHLYTDPDDTLDCSIDDCELFLSHVDEKDLADIRSVVLDAYIKGSRATSLQRLSELSTKYNIARPIRVYQRNWRLRGELDIGRCMAMVGSLQKDLRRFDNKYPGRTWRVFPWPMDERDVDILRKHLSTRAFDFAMCCINDGI